MEIYLIAALARNRAIGLENKLLYWLPNDMKRFRTLTTGHTIVMGRKTFESFPKGALPNRRNVVLSRGDVAYEGAEVYHDLESALRSCAADERVFVIGGASVYGQALPLAQHLCITWVEDTPASADAFFPEFSEEEWQVESEERHEADERHAHPYRFVDYLRR